MNAKEKESGKLCRGEEKRDRQTYTERERERNTLSHTHTHTHTQRKTSEKEIYNLQLKKCVLRVDITLPLQEKRTRPTKQQHKHTKPLLIKPRPPTQNNCQTTLNSPFGTMLEKDTYIPVCRHRSRKQRRTRTWCCHIHLCKNKSHVLLDSWWHWHAYSWILDERDCPFPQEWPAQLT